MRGTAEINDISWCRPASPRLAWSRAVQRASRHHGRLDVPLNDTMQSSVPRRRDERQYSHSNQLSSAPYLSVLLRLEVGGQSAASARSQTALAFTKMDETCSPHGGLVKTCRCVAAETRATRWEKNEQEKSGNISAVRQFVGLIRRPIAASARY